MLRLLYALAAAVAAVVTWSLAPHAMAAFLVVGLVVGALYGFLVDAMTKDTTGVPLLAGLGSITSFLIYAVLQMGLAAAL